MVCLSLDEMRTYLLDRAIHLAPRLRRWVEISREVGSGRRA
jgi:hypothetical protein